LAGSPLFDLAGSFPLEFSPFPDLRAPLSPPLNHFGGQRSPSFFFSHFLSTSVCSRINRLEFFYSSFYFHSPPPPRQLLSRCPNRKNLRGGFFLWGGSKWRHGTGIFLIAPGLSRWLPPPPIELPKHRVGFHPPLACRGSPEP